jgi:TolB-like protein/Tfp pilus assembly protein PilF
VEEANLTQTIFGLRKALGPDAAGTGFILTVPGRGYRFAAPVWLDSGAASMSPAQPPGVLESPLVLPNRQSPPPNPWRRTGLGAAGLAVALALCTSFVWRIWTRPEQPAPGPAPQFSPTPHSVAVLPFANMSGDPSQEYFSDGLSEELIGALSRIAALRVAARTSSFSFKGKPVTVGDIARALNVSAVLEGSVRRVGPRVRITAELVSATTGFELWARSYDRTQGDMLTIQGEIAEAVTGSLQATLLDTDVAKLTIGGTSNPQALDAYLRGMALLIKAQSPVNQASRGEDAVAEFDKAISIDPGYASARAGRARALITIAEGGAELMRARKDLVDARLEAERAIALSPDLAWAHLARGYALRESLDLVGADKEVTLARDLAPSDASVELSYAEVQLTEGHVAAAIEAAELAANLDPLTPATYYILGSRLAYARRYDEALIALRHGKALDHVGDSTGEGLVLYSLGRYDAARQACAGAQIWVGSLCLALVYNRLGRPADAVKELAKLGDNPFAYAEVYSQWGQAGAAVKWLETAYRMRDSGLTYLKVDPFLDAIRATTEYSDIEQRLNFPP